VAFKEFYLGGATEAIACTSGQPVLQDGAGTLDNADRLRRR